MPSSQTYKRAGGGDSYINTQTSEIQGQSGTLKPESLEWLVDSDERADAIVHEIEQLGLKETQDIVQAEMEIQEWLVEPYDASEKGERIARLDEGLRQFESLSGSEKGNITRMIRRNKHNRERYEILIDALAIVYITKALEIATGDLQNAAHPKYDIQKALLYSKLSELRQGRRRISILEPQEEGYFRRYRDGITSILHGMSLVITSNPRASEILAGYKRRFREVAPSN